MSGSVVVVFWRQRFCQSVCFRTLDLDSVSLEPTPTRKQHTAPEYLEKRRVRRKSTTILPGKLHSFINSVKRKVLRFSLSWLQNCEKCCFLTRHPFAEFGLLKGRKTSRKSEDGPSGRHVSKIATYFLEIKQLWQYTIPSLNKCFLLFWFSSFFSLRREEDQRLSSQCTKSSHRQSNWTRSLLMYLTKKKHVAPNKWKEWCSVTALWSPTIKFTLSERVTFLFVEQNWRLTEDKCRFPIRQFLYAE